MQLSLERARGNHPDSPSVSLSGFSVSALLWHRGVAAARALILMLLGFYKRWVSPLLPSACRFHPTCSEYAMDAIRKYGVVRGSGMGLLRLLRCHPFHRGGFDPVR